MNKTDAIKTFLNSNTLPDLASLYNYNMECQVNVAQDGGERIKGEYQGRQWAGWSDGVSTWKSFRIPYNAGDEPSYEDKPIRFSLADHAEGIGMTGWDWVNRCSKWVAFDFDALIGHSERHPTKLSSEELMAVREAAMKLPWTTIRRSTSGKGLHIYVFLDDVPTANHTEHAGLARSILHYMCLQTSFPFNSGVDVQGGNMWVWHRKMLNSDGLTLIKAGTKLLKIPPNWRDHIDVARGKRRRILPQFDTEELSGQKRHTKLDDEHQALIKFLDESGASFWWDQDHHMLVAHTYDLQQAHEKLRLRGVFSTVSTGTEQGADHNCFLYPLRRGAWVVRRYSAPGQPVGETKTWDVDTKGYTRCYLNQDASLKIACKAHGGVEHPTGGFVFKNGVEAGKAAKVLGVELELPESYRFREIKLKQNRQGRLVAELPAESRDNAGDLEDWLFEKKKFIKIFDNKIDEPEAIDVEDYDDLLRHLVSENGDNLSWTIKTEKQWTDEPLTHVSILLKSYGLKPEEVSAVLGNNIARPWQIVNRPFEPEYPGNRTWNRNAAQLRYAPNLDKDTFNTPTWDMILHHVGGNLTPAVQEHPWCQENGLTTGADYLRCWIASMFQKPYEQLPYLFLWGEQNTGKSILHEALALLMTQGYVRADMALQTQFNGELQQAILCVIEETSLRTNKKAYNTIKDYVTSLMISLHIKGATPIMVPNTTHWIQCSNDYTDCPIFGVDTRVTVIHVPELTKLIPKRDLIIQLQKEAPDFLGSILKLELPISNERLNLPVIETKDKRQIARTNETLLETFISECVYRCDGHIISISDFYAKFIEWLDPSERALWSKQKVSKNMHPSIPKGRNTQNAQWAYGNITFNKEATPMRRLVLKEKGDALVPE